MTSSSNEASVCVLDDDHSMLRAVERLLKSEGFGVTKFSEPSAFLERVEQAPCAVAILDMWMPDMTGLEVQTAMKKASGDTRIIFISGRDDPSIRQAALEAGAFAFLPKPFDDEELLQLVHQTSAA